jgi:hypothetical protein
MNIPETLRRQSVEGLFQTNTFNNCWSIWQPRIRTILSSNYNSGSLIDLGDVLSEIFQLTGGSSRSQSSLSGGGTAWESLICWYINLCCIGSRVVAIKKMSLVPKPIQDSITVNYGNFACNTESDITVIVFPDILEYNVDIQNINHIGTSGQVIPSLLRNKLNSNLVDELVIRDFSSFDVGIIQCKTNWNDNAQIPMLWDMIYSAGGFRGRSITLGKNNYRVEYLREFTYSFVTVPSNQNTIYNSNMTSVKRVTNLSGGNYWGKPTQPGVAKSIKEIFSTNFYRGFNTNMRGQLQTNLTQLSPLGNFSYFKL